MKLMLKVILVTVGSISVALGVIGIFLPLLPTTPFLLLAALCYLKSSNKLYQKLITNRYLGIYIKSYYEKKGIPLKIKVYALTTLWISISYSAFYMIDRLPLRVMLLIVASLVTWHILKQNTLAKDEIKKSRLQNN